MRRFTKKQKITGILAAAAFALLALLLIFLLLREPALRRDDTQEPVSSPGTGPLSTAAPGADMIRVAGKLVDAAADSFDLSGRTLSETDMAEIASLKNLTTLSLMNCGVSDLSFLSEMRSLRTLILPDNRINDLTPLAGLHALWTVYLDRNPLTDLTPLTSLPELRTLSIQGVTVADYVLEDLRQAMPSCRIFCDSVVESARPISMGGLAFTEDVEVLDLSARGLTDISRLAQCLQLRDLNLSSNPLAGLTVLSGLPRLTSLSLAGTGLADDSLRFLATLQRLTYLNIQDNPAMTAEAVDELKRALPNCQIVHDTVYYTVRFGAESLRSDAADVDLGARGLTDLTGLEKFQLLRRLALPGNYLTDISPLRELYGLEELDLSYNNVTDLMPLQNHAALRKLDLDHNGLQEIWPLSGCTGLEELDLSYNRLDDLAWLNGCAALRQLNIAGNPALTADQIRRLQEALPGCQIITDVDLSMPEPTPVPPPDAVFTPTPEPVPIPVFPEPIPIGAPEA